MGDRQIVFRTLSICQIQSNEKIINAISKLLNCNKNKFQDFEY